jgi:sporulation protein YlmC with PRC-barrel domain
MRIEYEVELRGRSVIDGTGRVIGAVDGLMIDSESWRVEAVRVRLRRDAAMQLGATPRFFQSATLEIPVELVHAAGDAVILNVPTTALRELKPAQAVEAT